MASQRDDDIGDLIQEREFEERHRRILIHMRVRAYAAANGLSVDDARWALLRHGLNAEGA